MEKHPDLARGFVKGDRVHFEQLWLKLTEELNASGPPKKESVAWKKVWSDLRLSVKQRLAHNKVEISKTGGGLFNRYILTPADEQIAIICGLYTSVDGISNANTYGVPRTIKTTKKVPSTSASTSTSATTPNSAATPNSATTSNSATTFTSTLAKFKEILSENETITNDFPVTERPASTSLSPKISGRTSSRKRRKHVADVDDVLNVEAEHFAKISANLVDIGREMKDNRRYLKEIALNISEIKTLKEKEIQAMTRHNLVIEKDLQTRNKINVFGA